MVERAGVLQYGFVMSADVAGEEDGFLLAVVVDFDLDHCGSEDVAGVTKTGLDTGGNLLGLLVSQGSKKVETSFDILAGIEGDYRVFALSALAFVPFALVASIFFLDVGRIEQDNFGYLGGSRGAVDFAGKSVLDQLGQVAAVVEMGVS